MTRTLVVAPQWIGDAVMAEPLLAALAERGEQITVAALPWVAPVFRAMPQVAETIELPFAHGRLDWRERRRIAATLRSRFDVAYVLPHSLKSALIPSPDSSCAESIRTVRGLCRKQPSSSFESNGNSPGTTTCLPSSSGLSHPAT